MQRPFDEEELLARFDDRELLVESVSLLREEWEKFLPILERAFAEGDRHTAEWAAHQLKGSLSHFAAPGPVEICRKLERWAASGEGSEVEANMEDLKLEVAEVLGALDSFVWEDGS